MIRRDADAIDGGHPAHDALPAAARLEEVRCDDLRLELLLVPGDDATEAAAAARAWVAAAGPADPPVVVPLYGTEVIWTQHRAAILARDDALEPLRAALLDFAGCDARLRRLERDTAALLEVVGDDAACAVEFDERHLARQPLLAERFARTVAIRAELAAVAPAVARPTPHPPTLAGQLGERLRERTRLADRLEFLHGRAEVLDRVYDLCAQRVGDFAVARRHLRLEWVIIVLLAAELVVLLVEVLAAVGTTPTS
jgi:hypothetical protein